MDGYNAFMLVATLLVLMMTTPALALFYGGMTRSKSVLNMMMMSYSALAIVGILWVMIGYSMVFGGDGIFFASPFTNLGLKDVGYDSYTFMMFQLTFAVITTALISGAIADRVKFSAWLLFVPLWATLVYFPLAHMVFSCTEDALICTTIGAQDYAGGTAVHINAGMAGLVLAAVVGKRVGFGSTPMQPHNLTLTMLGAALLWVGWYGFNVGSLIIDDERRRHQHPVPQRDRRDLHQHDAGAHGRDPGLAAGRARSCTARRPAWVLPRASSPAWSPSPRPPVRWTSGARSPSVRSPVRCAPGRSA